MPVSDRDYMRGAHPPSCTCVDCVNRRLKQVKDGKPKRGRYKMKGRFSVRKLFLNLLVLVCIAVPIWIAFQIFVSHTIPPTYGGIILAIDIGVLVWNISVLRHHSHENPSFWLMTLIVVGCLVILSFVGVQPLTDYRESATDWVSTRVSDISCSITSVAKIGDSGMWVGKTLSGHNYLYVQIVPTSRAVANTQYTVDLYENGTLRAQNTVSWTQAEINVEDAHTVKFPISEDEYDAYYEAQSPKTLEEMAEAFFEGYDNGWWRDIFSVKIRE